MVAPAACANGDFGERCAVYNCVHVLMTGKICDGLRSARVRLCLGENVTTWHFPVTGSALSSRDEIALRIGKFKVIRRWNQRTAIIFRWLILSLLLLDRAVVIDENECTFIFRIGITLSPSVAGAKVA